MGQLIKMKSYNNARNPGADNLNNVQNVKGNY